ncbi:MAG: type II toxin-antitoxin system HigB family toxin [Polyangiales bacterium]
MSRRTLRAFWERHAEAESPLKSWFYEAERADWRAPKDIRAAYRSADFVGDRVVFNIGGNKYRLVVHVSYAAHLVFIRWVGTHAAYDRIDVASV